MSRLKIDSPKVPQAPRTPELSIAVPRGEMSIAVPKGEVGSGARRLPVDGFDRGGVGASKRLGGPQTAPAPASFDPQTAPLSPQAEPFRQGVIDLAKQVAANPKLDTQRKIDRALTKGLKELQVPGEAFGELLDFGRQTVASFRSSGTSGQRDNAFMALKGTLDTQIVSIADRLKLENPNIKPGELRKQVKVGLGKVLPELDLKSQLGKQAVRYVFAGVQDTLSKYSGTSSERWSSRPSAYF